MSTTTFVAARTTRGFEPTQLSPPPPLPFNTIAMSAAYVQQQQQQRGSEVVYYYVSLI